LLFADLDAQLTASALALAQRMGVSSAEGELRADVLVSKEERNAWVTSLVPWHPQYQRLLPVLARYQRYAEGDGFETLEESAELSVGSVGTGVASLRRRLRQEGFESAVRDDSAPFGNALRQDLRDFQYSRGLPVTGVMDSQTHSALNIPLPRLIRQIRETLNTWRESPTRGEQTFLQVNLPEFVVELYRGRERQMRHRAVIGYAFGSGGGRTKRFHSQVEQVVLNPGWTPSQDIINNNLKPREEASPGYLQRRGFRWFTRPSGQRGLYQSPGPNNTLGRVKLRFPNENNIYLHGSPDQDQFELAARAMSHGCVRVQDVEELALELLVRDNMMDRAEFDGVLASQRTQEIRLTEPMPIHFEYAMVVVDDDAAVRFLPNVYRQRSRR
jgi:murein L,D-transpeptidase YcbB/YkuD